MQWGWRKAGGEREGEEMFDLLVYLRVSAGPGQSLEQGSQPESSPRVAWTPVHGHHPLPASEA